MSAGIFTSGPVTETSATVPNIGPITRSPSQPRGDCGPGRLFVAVRPFTDSQLFVPSQPAATSYHSPGTGFTGTETRGSGVPAWFTKKLNFTLSFPPSTRSR